MRSLRDDTKFHQMWRGPSIGAPPTMTKCASVAAVIVTLVARLEHQQTPGLELVAGDIDGAVDDIERALLVIGIERQASRRRVAGTSAKMVSCNVGTGDCAP